MEGVISNAHPVLIVPVLIVPVLIINCSGSTLIELFDWNMEFEIVDLCLSMN